MYDCCICGSFVVPCNKGIDHIGFYPVRSGREKYICRSCINGILDQIEYGVSVDPEYDYVEC